MFLYHLPGKLPSEKEHAHGQSLEKGENEIEYLDEKLLLDF